MYNMDFDILRTEYAKFTALDTASPMYQRIVTFVDLATEQQLEFLVNQEVAYVSYLASLRLAHIKAEEANVENPQPYYTEGRKHA